MPQYAIEFKPSVISRMSPVQVRLPLLTVSANSATKRAVFCCATTIARAMVPEPSIVDYILLSAPWRWFAAGRGIDIVEVGDIRAKSDLHENIPECTQSAAKLLAAVFVSGALV